MIKITESPRDAMQGLPHKISVQTKVRYINQLFKVGFDMIDIGSLVSSRAVPQMSDTKEVLAAVDIGPGKSKISLLAGNSRFAQEAALIQKVDFINYPFSVSDTFLSKNLKSDIEKSYSEIDAIINIAEQEGKGVIITVSSAFGNPYGDKWSKDILKRHVENLAHRGMEYIPLADTTSEADAGLLQAVFADVSETFPEIEFNIHLHTFSEDMQEKIQALYDAGCRSFDTVFNGMGGCPMSGRKLIANVNTADFMAFLENKDIPHKLDSEAFAAAAEIAAEIFG